MTGQARSGPFENLSYTPQLAPGQSIWKVMMKFFTRGRSVLPPVRLPSVKTDIIHYYSETPTVFWFGHSSYLIHYRGTNILVDPVFSGHASPFRFYLRAFDGSDVYKAGDMPRIDVLIITHNHYDHLDRDTIRELAGNTGQLLMPLGAGVHLEGTGVAASTITELDWWQETRMEKDIRLVCTPARHFSGRGLKRNGSLWASFVLEIGGYKIFIGSDSGYDVHFKEIGSRYGPFDLAILECGQYNEAWPLIHSFPEELVTEATDLGAKMIMPVHWGKFALALHPWDEPVKRFVTAAREAGINYTTPKIGEPVVLDQSYPRENWWEH